MNKLLQTTLIASILSTGVMASNTALPGTIESGATVYVNKNIYISGTGSVIDNYGNITTEITSEPYPKIDGDTTINNYSGKTLKEIEDSSKLQSILTNNPIEGINRAHEIVDGGSGTISDKIQLGDNVKVNTLNSDNLNFQYFTGKDLLYLGTDSGGKTIKVKADNVCYDQTSGTNYADFHYGDQGDEQYSYGLEFEGAFNVRGDFSNYKKGSIKFINDGMHSGAVIYNDEDRTMKFYVPMTIDGSVTMESTSLYNEVLVTNNGQLSMNRSVRLKSGATLRIGEAPTTTTGE